MNDWMAELRMAKGRAFDANPVEPDAIDVAGEVSPQYSEFLRAYGAVRIFPRGRAYRLHVHSTLQPVRCVERDLLALGNDDGEPVYLVREKPGVEPRVYAVFEGGLEEVGSDFNAWFAGAFARIRDSYSNEEWQALREGAKPFTARELAIIQARKNFDVAIEGIEHDNRVRLRVRNGSDLTLPWLTVGVRSTDPPLEGALWLDVSKIEPGATSTITVDAYRDQVDPSNLEIELRDPRPDDRNSFRELTARRD
jgi:hypothetical protein